MSGRKVELDEVIVPLLELESSTSQKEVPVIPTPTGEEVNDIDHETSDQVTTGLRGSTRTRSALEWYGNPVLEIMLLDNGEPTNYEEAMMGPDSDNPRYDPYMRTKYELWWTCPMNGKLLRINGSLKADADGNITIYKARLVAKGFRQVQGVDYDETFSPVAMLKSVIIMLAIAMFYEIWQMDVKTEFLNGFLEEVLYVMQPEGFVNPMVAN